MKDLYAGGTESRHRTPLWEYKRLGVGSVCVYVCVCMCEVFQG